jgi:hypothetical protein
MGWWIINQSCTNFLGAPPETPPLWYIFTNRGRGWRWTSWFGFFVVGVWWCGSRFIRRDVPLYERSLFNEVVPDKRQDKYYDNHQSNFRWCAEVLKPAIPLGKGVGYIHRHGK